MKPRSSIRKITDSLSGFPEDFMEERNQPPLLERVPLQQEKHDRPPLPEGWGCKSVGGLAEIIRGVSYNKSDASELKKAGDLAILRATNIQDNGLVIDHDMVYVPKKYVSAEQTLKIGDIVIATSSGSKHLVGKTAQVKAEWQGSFGAFCAVVRPRANIEQRYLGYFFNSPDYKSYISAKAIGVNINNLRRGDIEEIQVPLAPLDQQKLIVSEIEKQFSRLDEAVAALKRVRAGLKRYKASVLKAAVEGKLTEEWRKENPNVEPASELLKRILAERKKKWEEANPKKKYKEPAAPDTSNLPELPKGWVWSTVDAVCSVISGEAFKKKDYVIEGIRLFQIANVSFGRVVWDHKNYLPNKFLESFPDLKLKEGDVVMALNRPILDNMLKVARLDRRDTPAILYQRVAKFNFIVDGLSSYFYIFAQSPIFLKQVERNLQGTDQPYLNTSLIPVMIIPIPSLLEQQKIVEEIESRLSVAKEIEETIDINLKRAERLRQAILKKAFVGKLI